MAHLQSLFPRFTKNKDQCKDGFEKQIAPGCQHLCLGRPHRKIAILVACEYVTYDMEGVIQRLPGCHSDIKKMQEMLMEHYGYHYNNFIILSDENDSFIQPTRQNILETFQKLVKQRDLSRIVMYYSGHGTRTKDRFYKGKTSSKTNQKGVINIQKYLKTLFTFEDCIVPSDYLEAGLISDVCFRTHFWSKIPIWTKVTAIFDSCNSGSIFNLPYRYKNANTLERDLTSGFGNVSESTSVTSHHPLPLYLCTLPESGLSNSPFIVTISGCQNNQKSVAVKERHVGSDVNTVGIVSASAENLDDPEGIRDKQWEGCMSVAFREVLKSHNFGVVGLDTIIEEMRALLRHWNYLQIPQMSLSHNILPSSIVELF
jgi:hypothetical protein